MKKNAGTKFTGRMVGGCLIAIFLGMKLDAYFHTTPIIIICLLAYVIIGSFYLLMRESKHE